MGVVSNLTVSRLSASLILNSPMFSVADRSSYFTFQLEKSRFNKFGSNLYRASGIYQKATFKKSECSNFLSTAIYINSAKVVEVPKEYRYNWINKTQNKNFGKDHDSLACQEMIFSNCTTEYDGGAVFVVIGGIFYCNFTVFENCFTKPEYSGGGLYVVANNTNFTGSCFTKCSASRGSAFYNPESLCNTTMEICQFDFCNPDKKTYTRPKYLFDTRARDIWLNGNNFSKCSFISGFRFVPTHNCEFRHNTFENVTVYDDAELIRFKEMNLKMNLSTCIFANNVATNDKKEGYMFMFEGISLQVNNWIFINNTFDQFIDDNCNTLFTMNNCSLDIKKESINYKLLNDTGCSWEVKDVSTYTPVSTVGCWEHSTYTWSIPSSTAQGTVLGCLAAAVVVVIVALVFHKRHIDSKAPKDDDEDLNELVNAI